MKKYCFILLLSGILPMLLATTTPYSTVTEKISVLTLDQAGDQVKMIISRSLSTQAEVALFNLHGREVQQFPIDYATREIYFDMSEFPSGMYLAVIREGEQEISQYIYYQI